MNKSRKNKTIPWWILYGLTLIALVASYVSPIQSELIKSMVYSFLLILLIAISIVIVSLSHPRRRKSNYYYGFDFWFELKKYKAISSTKKNNKYKKYKNYVEWRKSILQFISKFSVGTEDDYCIDNFIAYLREKKRAKNDFSYAYSAVLIPFLVAIFSVFTGGIEETKFIVSIVNKQIMIYSVPQSVFSYVSVCIVVLVVLMYVCYDIGENRIEKDFLDDLIDICMNYKIKGEEKINRKNRLIGFIVDWIAENE